MTDLLAGFKLFMNFEKKNFGKSIIIRKYLRMMFLNLLKDVFQKIVIGLAEIVIISRWYLKTDLMVKYTTM